jgi:hypothetical protein
VEQVPRAIATSGVSYLTQPPKFPCHQVADHDFCSDAPFPPGHDVIAMGMVLHDWGRARKEELIRK